MNKKNLITAVVVVLVVAGGAFYGGTIYDKGHNSDSNQRSSSFGNLTPEQRQQMGGAGRNGGSRLGGGGFANGEIISKDDKTITIKLNNNRISDGQQQGSGSKLILYSDSTQVEKSVIGTLEDLTVGQSVMVNGTANSDGSVTAKSIQVQRANAIIVPGQPAQSQ